MTLTLPLADWQYNYVKESGVPFNFVNNRSYLEEIGEMPETSEETKTDEEELSEAAEELLEDADDKTKEETEKGIWDDTMNAIAGTSSQSLSLSLLSLPLW